MLVYGKMHEKLSKDEAIRLHRQMWNDMAEAEKKRGKKFSVVDRAQFKSVWLYQHSYSFVKNSCFLCEYAMQQEVDRELCMTPYYCDHCPLDWRKLVPPEQINELTEYDGRYGTCIYHMTCVETTRDELWTVAPIEDIANLPEKEEHDES